MSVENWHQFTITSPEPIGRGASIEMDGLVLQGVTRVSFSIGMDEPNKVTIEMYAKSINADVKAEIDEP